MSKSYDEKESLLRLFFAIVFSSHFSILSFVNQLINEIDCFFTIIIIRISLTQLSVFIRSTGTALFRGSLSLALPNGKY